MNSYEMVLGQLLEAVGELQKDVKSIEAKVDNNARISAVFREQAMHFKATLEVVKQDVGELSELKNKGKGILIALTYIGAGITVGSSTVIWVHDKIKP